MSQEKSLQQLRKRHVIRKLASGRRDSAYAIAKARGNAARMAAPLSLEEVVTLLQRRWQARKLASRDAAAIEHWKTAYAPNTFVRRFRKNEILQFFFFFFFFLLFLLLRANEMVTCNVHDDRSASERCVMSPLVAA